MEDVALDRYRQEWVERQLSDDPEDALKWMAEQEFNYVVRDLIFQALPDVKEKYRQAMEIYADNKIESAP